MRIPEAGRTAESLADFPFVGENDPDEGVIHAFLVSVRRALEFTHCTDSIAGLWSVP